ncbi:MAG: hypothetical protein HYU36_13465 [Planctomycetes bacterium]|nr:hypothetical protein [Planctomycetota bacterium]
MRTVPIFFLASLFPFSSFCDGLADLLEVRRNAKAQKRSILLFFQPDEHHTEASVLDTVKSTHVGKYLFDYGCDFAMVNNIDKDEALLLHVTKLIETSGAPRNAWPLFGFCNEDGELLIVGFWKQTVREGKNISGQRKSVTDAIYEHLKNRGLRPPLTTEELIDQRKLEAKNHKKYLVVHFGSVSARPSSAFNQTIAKWIGKKKNSDRFLFLFIDFLAMEGGRELYGDWLKTVDKAGLTVFPGIFVLSPEGDQIWFETGAAWGADTESSIMNFLTKWVEEKAR